MWRFNTTSAAVSTRSSVDSGSTIRFRSLRAICISWCSNMLGVRISARGSSMAASNASSSTCRSNRARANSTYRGELVATPLTSRSATAVGKVSLLVAPMGRSTSESLSSAATVSGISKPPVSTSEARGP